MQKYFVSGKDNWHNFEIVGETYRETRISAALGHQMKLDEEIEQTLLPPNHSPHHRQWARGNDDQPHLGSDTEILGRAK
jgi:hypothetical protein